MIERKPNPFFWVPLLAVFFVLVLVLFNIRGNFDDEQKLARLNAASRDRAVCAEQRREAFFNAFYPWFTALEIAEKTSKGSQDAAWHAARRKAYAIAGPQFVAVANTKCPSFDGHP